MGFDIMGVHWKIQFSGGGGGHKKAIYSGDCLKRRGLGQSADLRGVGLDKKEGGVILSGV